MKKFLVILCLAFSLSSCGKDTHRFQNYPEIITKYQLEDLHDRAKWEVYKINMLYGNDYLVNFESDSVTKKFYSLFKVEGLKLLQSKEALQHIVGKNNVLPFLNADLVLFETDSSNIFQGGEIILTFFPKRGKGKRWQFVEGRCFSIIFDEETIVGCGDYIAIDYPIQNRKKDDQQFIQLLKEKKDSNPWLDWYLKNREN